MARPSLDSARIEPAVRRMHVSGSSVREIARHVGVSVGSVHAMIGRLGLSRTSARTTATRRMRRHALPVGAGLEIARV
ncbi:hypothetical protein [Gluconobacter sp. GP1]|uniref:hypothetical protein n=1 Tax=Gluconobacter sp. GP1 TaxID=3046423 RepID=UPI00293EB517|nr:hypothetical protein [Gluconobacter sp. GP1]